MQMVQRKEDTALVPSEEGTRKKGIKKRWSARRKREVVMRMFRGESIDSISREIGIETYRLEEWRGKALGGLDAALKERPGDPKDVEIDTAMKRIGELTMENELLREKCNKKAPLVKRRSKK